MMTAYQSAFITCPATKFAASICQTCWLDTAHNQLLHITPMTSLKAAQRLLAQCTNGSHHWCRAPSLAQ
jgi:hypothetical protein